MHSFVSGIIVGIASIFLIGEIAISSQKDLCRQQNYEGRACQCQIVLYGDVP